MNQHSLRTNAMVDIRVREEAKSGIRLDHLPQRLLVGTILIICVGFVTVFPQLTLVAFTTFSIYYLWWICTSPVSFLKYLPLVFNVGVAVVGCYIIETVNPYLSELAAHSFYSGSLPLLTLCNWTLLETVMLYESVERPQQDSQGESWKSSERVLAGHAKLIEAMSKGVMTVCVLLFLHVAADSAGHLGIDRFEYASRYLTGLWGRLNSTVSYLVILPMLSWRYRHRKIDLATIVIYVFYLVWSGHKFGEFFTLVWLFILVYYDAIANKALSHTRVLVLGVAAAVIAIVLFASFVGGSIAGTRSREYLVSRATQQAQLYWRIHADYRANPQTSSFPDEMKLQFNAPKTISSNVGSRYGVYNIMYLCAPAGVVDSKLLRGSRYSQAGIASAYYYFGWPGTIAFSILHALAYCWLLKHLIESLKNLNPVRLTCLLWLRGKISLAFGMFIISDFFRPSGLVIVAVLVMSHLTDQNGGAARIGTSSMSSHMRKGVEKVGLI